MFAESLCSRNHVVFLPIMRKGGKKIGRVFAVAEALTVSAQRSLKSLFDEPDFAIASFVISSLTHEFLGIQVAALTHRPCDIGETGSVLRRNRTRRVWQCSRRQQSSVVSI